MILTGFGARDYRAAHGGPGASFTVRVEETDLWISADRDLSLEAEEAVRRLRGELEGYIARHPAFLGALEPVSLLPGAPILAKTMAEAGAACGVGPMAAVAGALAEGVALALTPHSTQVVVENGGDIYLLGEKERTVAVHAGRSPLSGRVGLRAVPGRGLSVCTSSGTVGPSLSFGRADAAVVLAPAGAVADAAATALGNRVKEPSDVEGALAEVLAFSGVAGALVIIGETLGAAGDIELVDLRKRGTDNRLC